MQNGILYKKTPVPVDFGGRCFGSVKRRCHSERLEGAKDPVTFMGVFFRCAGGTTGSFGSLRSLRMTVRFFRCAGKVTGSFDSLRSLRMTGISFGVGQVFSSVISRK